VTAPAKRRATYADLQAVSPTLVAEIIDGDLVTHPRPLPRHGIAAMELGGELRAAFGRGPRGPGGWIFMPEPELHLGPDIVVPDLAGWRRERFAAMPETNRATPPPDWVCEIISPSTERYDRGTKRRIYARAGVPFMWLLDPRSRFLEAFTLVNASWLLGGTFEDQDEVRAPPFEAVAFPLGALWPFDAPPEDTPNDEPSEG